MIEAECLVDRAQLSIGINQLPALGIVGGHSSRKLTPILNVQQHPCHQAGDFFGPLRWAEWRGFARRQVVNGSHATFVIQFAHRAGRSSGKNGGCLGATAAPQHSDSTRQDGIPQLGRYRQRDARGY